MAIPTPAAWADLLQTAVSDPGIISGAYRPFHQYSLGNQLLAWSQCLARGIQPGPMATYPKWRELGRHVRRGEKALTLCMPVTVKRPASDKDETEDSVSFTRFIFRPHWFVLAQTDGSRTPAGSSPHLGPAEGAPGPERHRDRVRRDRRQRDGPRPGPLVTLRRLWGVETVGTAE